MRRPGFERLLCAACVALFVGSLLRHLSVPLFWQDEGETAMFATRILEVGYPKVHGAPNVLYEFGAPREIGVKASDDAYLGKTWADFYFAVPGVWWAQGSADPYTRTLRVRLPFALAGAAGVCVWLWGVLPALPRSRRLRFASAYFALCALSISLMLHLREARYYPLLVGVLGALVALHLRHFVLRTLSWRRYAVATAASGALLFHVFFAAWFPVLGLLAVDAARQAWRDSDAAQGRGRRVACALLPLAIAVALTLPALVYFETFSVAASLAREAGVGPRVWLANAGFVLAHFARHEWLLAALLARGASAWVARGAAGALRAETQAARAVSSRLLAFAAGYVAFGCVNPLFYERYFVALSPALLLAFLLDGFSLRALLSTSSPMRRRACALGLALLVGVSLLLRRDALVGRIAELRTPVRGPIDFIVEDLRRRHAQPSALRIATNYEAHPLMYYLGSHVVGGLELAGAEPGSGFEPDLVIPRRRWPRSLLALRRSLARADWRAHPLPVLDTHYNEIPSLTASPTTPDPHRFETPSVAPEDPSALRILERVRADG